MPRRATAVLLLAAAGLVPVAAAPPAPAAASATTAPEPGCDDDAVAWVPRTPSALAAMTVEDAWDRGALGQGVTVAVVHAGVDATNAHLDGAVLPGRSFVPGDDDPTGRTTTVDEGTVLATVVAGRRVDGSGVVGVAPQAQVLPVRWYVADGSELPGGSKESAGVGRLAEAITWAGANGADVVVVPNAVSAADPALEAAVRSVQRAGGLVVASAGRATGGEPRWPAAYPGVLGVTGVGADGSVGEEPATGEHVAIAAPGDDVVGGATGRRDCVVLPPGSPPSSEWAVGTLAGAAALVRSAHPAASAEEVAYRLLASAQRPRQSQRSEATGWGLVRPYAAITLTLDPARPGPPFPGGVGAEGAGQVRTIEAARAAPDPAAPARRAAVWWGLLGLAALGVLVLLTRWNRLTDARFGEGSGGG
jgi:membrane-anchored mycosin MYCP